LGYGLAFGANGSADGVYFLRDLEGIDHFNDQDEEYNAAKNQQEDVAYIVYLEKKIVRVSATTMTGIKAISARVSESAPECNREKTRGPDVVFSICGKFNMVGVFMTETPVSSLIFSTPSRLGKPFRRNAAVSPAPTVFSLPVKKPKLFRIRFRQELDSVLKVSAESSSGIPAAAMYNLR